MVFWKVLSDDKMNCIVHNYRIFNCVWPAPRTTAIFCRQHLKNQRVARFIWRFLIWVPLLPGWMIRGNLRNDCRTVASQLRNHYDASLDFNDPVRHFKIIISLESPLYWIISLWNYVIHFRPRGIWSNQKHWCTLNSENYDLFLNVWILKYEQSEILAWNLDKFVIILYKVNTP